MREGGGGGRPNHFPCWLHRREGVKDHNSTVLLPPSSPLRALLKRAQGGAPLPLPPSWGFSRSDGWLHKEPRSISLSQNVFKWLFHFVSVHLRLLWFQQWQQPWLLTLSFFISVLFLPFSLAVFLSVSCMKECFSLRLVLPEALERCRGLPFPAFPREDRDRS